MLNTPPTLESFPRPALLFIQGRSWCGLVLAEYEARCHDPSVLPVLENTLAIGQGCDSETEEEAGETESHGWQGAPYGQDEP